MATQVIPIEDIDIFISSIKDDIIDIKEEFNEIKDIIKDIIKNIENILVLKFWTYSS